MRNALITTTPVIAPPPVFAPEQGAWSPSALSVQQLLQIERERWQRERLNRATENFIMICDADWQQTVQERRLVN